MLASFNWLKEFVKIDQDVKTFGDTLTMAGTKVETITPVNEKVRGIVTGKITKIEKHPNADRLRVCTVAFGENKTLPIINTKILNKQIKAYEIQYFTPNLIVILSFTFTP